MGGGGLQNQRPRSGDQRSPVHIADTTAAGGFSAPVPPARPVAPLVSCGPEYAGAGPDTGGKSLPISASTGSGTSGSVNTTAAFVNIAAARVVSSAGSPGPEPTNM